MSEQPCHGPLIWFDVQSTEKWPAAAILECSSCGYAVVSGSFNDTRHATSPVMREGLAR